MPLNTVVRYFNRTDHSLLGLNRLVFYIWLMGLISLLSPVAIYPAFFALFSFCVVALYGVPGLSRGFKLKLPAFFVWPVLLLGLISYLLNYDQSDSRSAVKFFVNLFFLLCSMHYFEVQGASLQSCLPALSRACLIFVGLIVVQLFASLLMTGMWAQLLTGVSNSQEAYQIGDSGFWLASDNKNILGSKALLIGLGYAGLYRSGAFGKAPVHGRILIALVLLFISLAAFARTVLAAALFPLFIYYWDVGSRFLRSRTLALIAGIVVVFMVVGYVSEKLLRVSAMGTSDIDGVTARFVLWKFFFTRFDEISLYFGNGFLSLRRLYGSTDIEDNLHNVYLNTYCDLGILPTLSYVVMLGALFLHRVLDGWIGRAFFFVPFIVITNSQYLGYESDLVFFFCFLYIHYLLSVSDDRQQSQYKIEIATGAASVVPAGVQG